MVKKYWLIMVGPVRKRKLHWQEKSVECLKGTKHVLKSWDKYKWEHWGLWGKMSRKWQEKNAERGATIQIPDNCVPKTEQSRNSGIPQEISASVCSSLPSLQSLCSFRSYVIPDPRRPPSIPKQLGQISQSAHFLLPQAAEWGSHRCLLLFS